MNELLDRIARDLNIIKYSNESDESYASRLIYSAIGLRLLTSGKKTIDEEKGITKHAQTRITKSLLKRYMGFFPHCKQYFIPKDDGSEDNLVKFIRIIYEETGYMLKSKDGLNTLNKGNEFIKLSDDMNLFFGISKDKFTMSGLGINTFERIDHGIEKNVKEFLIRDDLTPEEFVDLNYCEYNFEEENVDTNNLEYFNPLSRKNIHKSWGNIKTRDKIIARDKVTEDYYKVLFDKSRDLLFFDRIKNEENNSKMSQGEYYRIYLALRSYYNNPPKAEIINIDKEYSLIKIYSTIPNREWFFFFLNGWPLRNIEDKYKFIIRNYFVELCVVVLQNIGFKVNY